jgi:hypothetical protein
MIINVRTSSCEVPILFQILVKLQFFSDRVLKTKSEIYNFMKIRPVGAELFMLTEGQTDMTLTVAFRDCGKSSKIHRSCCKGGKFSVYSADIQSTQK